MVWPTTSGPNADGPPPPRRRRLRPHSRDQASQANFNGNQANGGQNHDHHAHARNGILVPARQPAIQADIQRFQADLEQAMEVLQRVPSPERPENNVNMDVALPPIREEPEDNLPAQQQTVALLHELRLNLHSLRDMIRQNTNNFHVLSRQQGDYVQRHDAKLNDIKTQLDRLETVAQTCLFSIGVMATNVHNLANPPNQQPAREGQNEQ